MIIDTTEVQDINSFFRLKSLKEVYGILWVFAPIFTLVLGITISVLAIRIGPEYAGPLGVLQALADGTKLLFKESLIPSRGDTRLFSIGPSISVISIIISYSVIPFGYNFVLSDLNIGIFLWISISSIAPIGLLMSRYGSNNKYSFSIRNHYDQSLHVHPIQISLFVIKIENIILELHLFFDFHSRIV
ncbi:hypothetical protein AAHE18_U085400 [Arachis hypogaea]